MPVIDFTPDTKEETGAKIDFTPEEPYADIINAVTPAREPEPAKGTVSANPVSYPKIDPNTTTSDFLEKPLIDFPEMQVKPDDSFSKSAGKEAINVALSIPKFATSPLGIMLATESTLVPGAGTIVSTGFLADMTYNLGKQLIDVVPNWREMTPSDKGKAIADLVGTGFFVKVLGGHVREKIAPKPEVVPEALKFEPKEMDSVEWHALRSVAPLTADALKQTGDESLRPRENIQPDKPLAVEIPSDEQPLAEPTEAERIRNNPDLTDAQKYELLKGGATETPLNPGGSQADLSPELQAQSKANNSREAFERVQQEADAAKEPIVDQPVNKEEPSQNFMGMGGAVPSEFENDPNSYTSIKNAQVDQERVKRGLPEVMQPAKKSFGDVWDKAMAKIDQDPEWPEQLVKELNEKPRSLTDEEDAALLHRQVDLQNQYGRLTRELGQAFEDGRMDNAGELKVRVADMSDKLLELYNAGKSAGTETGRGLNARKMMANENFELGAMETEVRAAQGGKPLTDEQSAIVKELHEKIAATQKAHDEYVAQSQERISKAEAEKAIAELKLKQKPQFGDDVLRIAKGIVDKWDKAADEARTNLKERLARTSAGLDPTILIDLAKVGRSHLGHAALTAAELGAKLVEEFGDVVKPHLQEIYDASKQLMERSHKEQPEHVKRALKQKAAIDKSTNEVIAQQKEKIVAKTEKGESGSITPQVKKIAESIYAQGVHELDSMIHILHGILKETDPEITRQETMDALSGRGKFWQASQDVIKKGVRDLSTQARLVGHQMDVEAGKPLPRTGYQPDEMSDTARREAQKLEDLKRKHGVVITDPAAQLASALQARKTYYTHRMADLKAEIASGERRVKSTNKTTDSELESLKSEYNKVKEEHDAVFSKDKPLTDEQRLKMATASVKSQIEEYERRIREGDFKGAEKKPITGPELEAVKSRRDALREQYNELRDLDEHYQQEQFEKDLASQKKALEDSITEKQNQLASGDVSTKSAEVNRPAIPELESLKQQQDELNNQLAEARKKPAEQKYAEKLAAQVKALQKRIADKEAALAKGDIKPVKSQQNRPSSSPELEIEKQRLEAVNKKIAELRKGPKKTPEQRALQAFKTRTANRIADLLEKLAKEDFSKTPRRELKLDAEAMRLKSEAEKVKEKYRVEVARARLATRTRGEKISHAIGNWYRAAILSNPVVIGKLTMAALARAVISPTESVVATGLSKLPGIGEVAKRSPRYNGLSLRAEMKSMTQGITEGMKDAWEVVKTGRSNLDRVYGKEKVLPHSFIDIFGNIHGALKAPIKRAEFARSFEMRAEFYAKQGVDVTDPMVQTKIGLEAYADAQRAIFQQKSKLAGEISQFLSAKSDKITGKPSAFQMGKELGGRILLPIRTVPVNIVAETAEFAFGHATGSIKLAKALRKGVETLSPEEADIVMRHLARGSLGMAALALGFLAQQYFGGYYQGGAKRKATDMKPDSARFGEHDIPSWALHNTLVNTIQLGATVRKVADSKLRKHDTENQGIAAGTLAGLLGLAEQTPGMRAIGDIAKIIEPHQRQKKLDEFTTSLLVPALASKTAQYLDKDAAGNEIKRDPKTLGEHLKAAIPGLRKGVKAKGGQGEPVIEFQED